MDPSATSRIKHALQVLTTLLMEALRDTQNRGQTLADFQKEVWSLEGSSDEFPELRILRELALDLDYYDPDPTSRQTDTSKYGDPQLEAKIAVAIQKLTEPKKA